MGSSADLFPRLFPPSSQDFQNKVGAPDGTAQNLGEPVDLSVSPIEPGDTVMETSTAPAIKLSFKEIVSSVQKQNKATKNIEGSAETSVQPPPPRLITLSTLGSKNEDAPGKRTRSLETVANEPAQKKPPQNSLASPSEHISIPFCWNSPIHGIRTRREKLKKRSRGHARTFNGHVGHSPRT
jgi:hypothetical protein